MFFFHIDTRSQHHFYTSREKAAHYIQPMSRVDVLKAYRQLYKLGLRAVRCSVPARYSVRDILRDSFRNEPHDAFEATRIQNTIHFLERASLFNGMEHKVLKTVLTVRYHRHNFPPSRL